MGAIPRVTTERVGGIGVSGVGFWLDDGKTAAKMGIVSP